MRIPSFAVRNERSVRLAACDQVPRVMVVTGPNGSGKSTLLQALRYTGGAGQTLYVGPHRTSRRQQVRMRFLGQQPIRMTNLLSSQRLPGFEGITIPTHSRDAWDFDEASSYLKYSLCQIELERQAAIAERLDSTGAVTKAEMPDVWEPLREMTQNLLPHLHFHRIDVSNRDQILCLWNVHSKDVRVDIDDLSSGEKSIIQLFFPLIEHRVQERLERIRGGSSAGQRQSICVLMDEPELHLHPNLQAKILDYIRSASLGDGTQFILASHSPTLVEQATSEELYLLRPAELVGVDENQLVQIATDDERLTLMREVFGSTSNITAMRQFLVVEGGRADDKSRRPSDARIYTFLNEQFNQLTIVSGGGKSEVRALARTLNSILGTLSPDLRAVALTDRDLDTDDAADANVFLLPVSMIENFLLDPEVIWEATATVRHKTSLASPAAVEVALTSIVDRADQREIERRTKARFAPRTFRLSDPILDAPTQVQAFAKDLVEHYSLERVQKATAESRNEIEKLKATNRRREHFDGKWVLGQFYSEHLHASGMSREIFVYECARQASKRKSVQDFAAALFASIKPPTVSSSGSATAVAPAG